MTAVNYEMLGRYVEAKERAEKLMRERALVLGELKRLINGDHSSDDVKKICWEKAEELLGRARVLDGELRAAWDDGNAAGETLGKARLDYRR